MKFEYSIWNITNGWIPLEDVSTIEGANMKIKAMGPYAEELHLRNAETKEEFKRNNNG